MRWAVRCFVVLIHGRFKRRVRLGPDEIDTRGFYTTRWVLADDEEDAVRKAFRSAERELQRWSDVRDGIVGTDMEAERIGPGSWWRWLKGGGRGFAYYTDD